MIVKHSLAVILLLALALRLGFLVLAGVDAPLTGDELAYQQIAENVASGRGLFQTNNPFFPGETLYAWQAPLYPLLLGFLYEVSSSSPLTGKLATLLVSTATVYVVYDLARRVFRAAYPEASARRAGLGAALWVAVYPGLLTLAHLLLSETLFIFFMVLAFDLAARALAGGEKQSRTWLWAVGAGAAWGLATLTRGITLYFTPLFALWLGWCLWRQVRGRSHALGAALVGGGLCAAVTLAVILPYAARNYGQFGEFVLLETKGGVNLWLGNSPYTPNEFIRNVWKVGVREPMLAALPAGELPRDRAAYALALNYIRAEPLTFGARMPVKFADFWGFERNLVDIAEATTRGQGWNSLAKIAADAVGILGYIVLALMGTAGFLFSPEEGAGTPKTGDWKILFGGFVAYLVLVHLVIFGDGRFHLPLILLFALYAGWLLGALLPGGGALWEKRLDTRSRRLGLAVVALALAAVWAREAWAAYRVLVG